MLSSTADRTPRLNALLLGNSRNEGSTFLEHAEAEVAELFGSTNKILVISYANPPKSKAEDRAHEYFARRAKEVVIAADSPTVASQLAECDGVFIQGGNTWRLLRHLYDNELITPLRTRAHDGTPFLGTSAGSNVMCPTIGTTNDMPIAEVPSLSALDLIPFQINAHFVPSDLYIDNFTGETRQQRLEEFARETQKPVLALPEGSGLWARGATYTLVGPNEAVIFAPSGESLGVPPGPLSAAVVAILAG